MATWHARSGNPLDWCGRGGGTSLAIPATRQERVIVNPVSWRLVHDAHVREVEGDICGEVRVRSLLQEDLCDKGLPAEGNVHMPG